MRFIIFDTLSYLFTDKGLHDRISKTNVINFNCTFENISIIKICYKIRVYSFPDTFKIFFNSVEARNHFKTGRDRKAL